MSDFDKLFAEADAFDAPPPTEARTIERRSGSRQRVGSSSLSFLPTVIDGITNPIAPLVRAYRASQGDTEVDSRDAAFLGLADTVSFGFADEIGAAADHLLFGKDYHKALADNHQLLTDVEEDHGSAYLTGQLAGGFVPILGWGGRIKSAVAARGLTSGLKGMVVAGGVQGAIYGAGSAEGGLQDRLLGSVTGGAFGAAGGYILGAAIIPAAKWGGRVARDMVLTRYGKTPRLTTQITPASIEHATADVADDLKALKTETATRAAPGPRSSTPSALRPTFNRLTGQADDVLDEGAILTTRELVGEMSAARKAIQERVGKMTVQQAERWAQRLEKAELDGSVIDDPHYRSFLGIDPSDHGMDMDTAKRAALLLEEATEAVLEKAGMGSKTTGQQDHAFRAAYGAGVTEADTAAALERSQQAVMDGRLGGHQQMLAALQFTRAKDKYLPAILKGDREARDALKDELTKAVRIHAEGTAIKANIARGLADMRWSKSKLAMAEIRDDVMHVETEASIRARISASMDALGDNELTDLFAKLKTLDDMDRVQEVLLNPEEAQAVSGWRRTMNSLSAFIKSNSLTPASGVFNTIGFIAHDFFRNGAARRWAARNLEIAGRADEAMALRFELEVGRRVYMAAHKRGIRAALDRIKCVNRRAKLTPYRRPILTPPFGSAAVIPVVDRRGPRTTTRTVRCAGGGVRGRSLLTHRVNRRGWGSGGRGFGLSSGF
ncbi:hypothetical protein [Novosphingobium lindaniclasticum]|uniref:Uncharacterized protein n=1 Tax=Novosphingobium lindaniclasticum LE124 TaxID=1096930 RepID=T0HE92_9SPHN|nr:hypothetical protein [Novosphingobium lindaniclasticum]EQB10423.1 hypothetical protein L284_17175 [Novosphingobium lindaniclasticum LE124]